MQHRDKYYKEKIDVTQYLDGEGLQSTKMKGDLVSLERLFHV